MPRAPQSRSGRYADLETGQLADVIEQAYEHDELPDWELVFELARRAMAIDTTQSGDANLPVSRPA